MDIAKIRKKAKAKIKSDEVTVAPAQEQVAKESLESSEEPESIDLVVAAEPPVVSDNAVVVTGDVTSGLDRLFAVPEKLDLETDDTSADFLENQTRSKSQTSRQYLAFHLSDEEYALDITVINEIIKVRELTDVPRSPAYILGIISLRGVVVPVFDLRSRLNLGTSDLMLSSRIVVCSQNDVTVGLLVDSINQVVNLVDDEVEPPPGVLSGLDREMVDGIGRCQGRMIILLNLHSVLSIESI